MPRDDSLSSFPLLSFLVFISLFSFTLSRNDETNDKWIPDLGPWVIPQTLLSTRAGRHTGCFTHIGGLAWEGGRAFGDCIFRAWFCVLGGFEAGDAWVGDVMGRDEMRRDATTWGGTKADGMEWSSPVVSSRSFASSGSSGERVEEAEIPREGRLGLGWISVGLGRGWGLGITVIHTRTCNAGAGRFSFWRWTRFVFLFVGYPRLADLDERCWFLDTRLFNTRTNAYLLAYLPIYLSTS